jgi:sec-independent protein translocase protein TatB
MLSIPHLIIIFVVALIVLGPEKLPEVARTLSKAMLEFRNATSGMRETLEEEMRQLEREISETKSPAPAPVPQPQPALNPAPEVPAAPPNEVPQEPADTADLDSRTEAPFPADSTEAVNTESSDETQTAETSPGKPTDEHTTAA